MTNSPRQTEKNSTSVAKGLVSTVKEWKKMAPIGEEAVFETPDLITRLDSAELAIVIDPIDGTWNYAHGLRHFGMIIAIVKNGETIFGLLYDPLADDWIVGSKGQGVYYQKPEAPSKPLDFKTEEGEEKRSKEKQRLEKNSGIIYSKGLSSAEASALTSAQQRITSREPLRCSCHEYRQLLLGEVDFVLTDHNPMPWDHLAGQFLVAEAGGQGGACHQQETGYPRLLSARTAGIWRGINKT